MSRGSVISLWRFVLRKYRFLSIVAWSAILFLTARIFGGVVVLDETKCRLRTALDDVLLTGAVLFKLELTLCLGRGGFV